MSPAYMTFKEIAAGAEVFIDANIFVYHFLDKSSNCSDFLALLEEGEYRGLTSVNVMTEVLHRLMVTEAKAKKLVRAPRVLKKLNENPEIICRLTDYSTVVQAILDMSIRILPLTSEHLLASQAVRSQYGLLVNDSLIVAMMKENGIDVLATNDEAFARVDWIRTLRPMDVVP